MINVFMLMLTVNIAFSMTPNSHEKIRISFDLESKGNKQSAINVLLPLKTSAEARRASEIYMSMDDIEKALEVLQPFNMNVDACFKMAEIYEMIGEPQFAITVLEPLKTTNPEVCIYLANVYERIPYMKELHKNKAAKALKDCKEINLYNIDMRLSKKYEEEGDFDSAIEAIKNYRKEHNRIANLYKKKGDVNTAVKVLEDSHRSRKLTGKITTSAQYEKLILWLVEKGDIPRAIELQIEYTTSSRPSQDARLYLADLLIVSGEKSHMVYAYNILIWLQGVNLQASLRLQKISNNEDVKEIIKTALDHNPGDEKRQMLMKYILGKENGLEKVREKQYFHGVNIDDQKKRSLTFRM